ncbi:MAG: LysR family transcriptional regulator [Gammaproteobacteria bacterium]|nr:LysR family transcriptional regulator [Gammaproteobacteria bacterium]
MSTTNRMPSLRSLRAFQVAARHLSFKLAAEELCLSASAVSHQVRNLESFLDLELFTRKTRALELTAPGRSYFEFLDSMFTRLQMETHQLRAEYGRKMIRLCLPPFFASELFLPKMDMLHRIMPDTDIRITTQPSLMKIHPAEADLSVLLGNGDWESLTTYPLFARRLVIAAAPTQLKRFDRSSFASLNGKTLIVHENRPNAWTNWAMEIDLPEPSAGNILRFDSMSSVVQAAAQGLGFAIIPLPMSQNWFKTGTLVKVFDTEWVTDEQFHLAHREEELNRPEVIEFIQWVKQEFKNDG